MPPKSVTQTRDLIEKYFDDLQAAGIDLYATTMEPQSASAMSEAENLLGVEIPTDVREFLGQGFSCKEGSFEDGSRFAGIGFTFLEPEYIAKNTLRMRQRAKETNFEGEHVAVLEAGFFVTHEEPQIVVSKSGVYHFSFSNPLLRVGDSFSSWLLQWLASGCFGSHDFDLAWSRVKDHVPVKIPVEQNSWVQAYKRQFAD